jgi:hypothetical protein
MAKGFALAKQTILTNTVSEVMVSKNLEIQNGFKRSCYCSRERVVIQYMLYSIESLGNY